VLSPNYCRFCHAALHQTFADLGASPLSNAFLCPDDLGAPEPYYPLKAQVCTDCFLVQLPAVQTPESIFSEYAYFSSYSQSWLDHAAEYVRAITARLSLTGGSQVIEIASNDGYLLQYFRARGVPVLGIEPAANVARIAEERGVPTLVRFFGEELARELAAEGRSADLIVGNNVLAHVPDLNDFVAGLKLLLKPDGVLTMEFPHLLRLMQERQFDTIYHEHFSYFSLGTARRVFARHGIEIFDVEELRTHGGSLRVFGRHAGSGEGRLSPSVAGLLGVEREAGLDDAGAYAHFQEGVDEVKRDLLRFLIAAKQNGDQIVGYGAPAKGNTLLNYCGIRTDFLDYTVDRSPYKQGSCLPGSRIPVLPPETIRETRPDYVLILPWNLKDEIVAQLAFIREWGGKFIIPIPTVEVA
jgi:SAM-dependent methyltransferase